MAGPKLWAALLSAGATGLSRQLALCRASGSSGERSQCHLLPEWGQDRDSAPRPRPGGKHLLPVSSTLRTPLYETKASIF